MLQASPEVEPSVVVVQVQPNDDNDHGEQHVVGEQGAEVWTMSPATSTAANRSLVMDDEQQQSELGIVTTVNKNNEPVVAASSMARSGNTGTAAAQHPPTSSSTPLQYPQFTRLNLTALPVRNVTKRWDDDDTVVDAAAGMDADQELPSHPVTCWWLTVSAMLTVLFYSACLFLIPLTVFLLSYYLAFKEEQAAEMGNQTQPPRVFGSRLPG